MQLSEDQETKLKKTTDKLFFQGNGGLDVTTNSNIEAGHEKWEYTNVFPNKEGFYFEIMKRRYI